MNDYLEPEDMLFSDLQRRLIYPGFDAPGACVWIESVNPG
jgi:hypothetical protein